MTLPQLSLALATLELSATGDVALPTAAMLNYPERAVQFGTGAFLRGFIDAFLDEANTRGAFCGRVVVIGSTGSGRDRAFGEQDGLYTIVSRGVRNGIAVDARRVVGAVSRALSATAQWDDVLACARNPLLSVVFSNTTEVGIALVDDDAMDAQPPRSFPAKLTRFLYERARTFAFAPSKGVAIVPCELIVHNGSRLRELVLQQAERWQLEPGFARWLTAAVPFCNTLVDRIVPGAPSDAEAAHFAKMLGYRDELLTMAEPFRQFVIEGDSALASRLSFVDGHADILVTPDLEPYRQRKVALLNGAHTLSVALALLSGCETVHDAMQHAQLGPFIRHALLQDIVPTLDVPEADAFARAVLERFANPYIQHALFDITLHGTTKWRVRLVPTLVRATQRHGAVPASLALGFAAHLLFLRGDLHEQRRAQQRTVPADDDGTTITAAWRDVRGETEAARLRAFVEQIAQNRALWQHDLTVLPRFVDQVSEHLARLVRDGAVAAVDSLAPAGVL